MNQQAINNAIVDIEKRALELHSELKKLQRAKEALQSLCRKHEFEITDRDSHHTYCTCRICHLESQDEPDATEQAIPQY